MRNSLAILILFAIGVLIYVIVMKFGLLIYNYFFA